MREKDNKEAKLTRMLTDVAIKNHGLADELDKAKKELKIAQKEKRKAQAWVFDDSTTSTSSSSSPKNDKKASSSKGPPMQKRRKKSAKTDD